MINRHILFKRILPSILITTVVLIYIGSNFANKKISSSQSIQANFNLEDMNGNKFNQNNLKEKSSILFFGFTHCPDICPVSLQLLTNLIENLGSDADKINYYFITIDPQRDTKEVLKQYLNSFDQKILGITGKHDELKKIYNAFDIHVKKNDLGKGNHTIDHTMSFKIINNKTQKVGTMMHEGFSKLIVIDNFGKIQIPKNDVVNHLRKLLQL